MVPRFAEALSNLIAEYQKIGTSRDEICTELELAAMALDEEPDDE